ncbi:MAG: ABC transporter permease [Candidatus Limnocylindrales bacterium]
MIGPTLAPARVGEPRSWGLWIGAAMFAGLVALVLLGPLVWDIDPTFESFESLTEFGEPLDAGAEGHPLGTDQKGRDVLARLLHAGRLTLLTALVSVGVATVAGLLVGLLASNSRRILGSVLMRFTDLGLAIPGLLLAAAISTVLGRGTLSLVIGLAAVFWAPIARVTYGQAVVLREREYVEAARVQGAGPITLLGRHILPHLLPVVGAYAALSIGWAVLFEASLGFLGVGVQEPDASIGSMLGDYLAYYRRHPGLILFPALFLATLVIAANLAGEALRTRTEER